MNCGSCRRQLVTLMGKFRDKESCPALRELWLVSGYLGIWRTGTTHQPECVTHSGIVTVGYLSVCVRQRKMEKEQLDVN